MKRHGLFRTLASILLIGVMLFGFASVAFAVPDIPAAPSGENIYVLDQAGMLSDKTEANIGMVAGSLDKATKAQVIVVTVPTLGSSSPEEFGLEILRRWGVGDKDKDNGVVILLAKAERIVRIEVGYGLEGRIPDAKAGDIIRDMTPSFSEGDFDKGIMVGFTEVIDLVCQEYGITASDLDGYAAAATRPSSDEELPTWVIVALVILLLIIISAYRDSGDFSGFIWTGDGGNHGGGSGSSGGSSFGGGSGGGGGATGHW